MKKKLNLNELRVKSFVTDMSHSSTDTVKGGAGGSFLICESINVCTVGHCHSNISDCLCEPEQK